MTSTEPFSGPYVEPEISDDPLLSEGDHDLFSHIVNDASDAEARIMRARVFGIPLLALCGKKWIPQRDPSRFPLCPDCIKIYEQVTGKKWGP